MKIPLRLLLSAFAAAAVSASSSSVRAQPAGIPTTVYAFAASEAHDPNSPLVQTADGNFYGTTGGGTGTEYGTVFKLTPAGELTTVYKFGANQTDGKRPVSLMLASDGNLYGTTEKGGNLDAGTVFKVDLAHGNNETILHSFPEGLDSLYPEATLVEGVDGNLYGTTVGVNVGPDQGTVYKITTSGIFTNLHIFDGHDGVVPAASLTLGRDGFLYGSTVGNDADGVGPGTIYRVTPNGAVSTFIDLATLAGPANIFTALFVARDGNFYGTSLAGGDHGTGAFFQILPAGTLTVLHSLGGDENENTANGLVQANDGNFYGSTPSVAIVIGGISRVTSGGTLFRITAGGTPATLYTFPSFGAGISPSNLIKGSDGRYYGTTRAYTNGSSVGYGSIFVVNLVSPPGTLAFASGTANVAESAGGIALTLTRTGGSEGVVSVNVATADGTAVDSTDYTKISTTVSWADTDTADKQVVIPILNPGVFGGGTKTFTVTLADATGGTTLGSRRTQTVSILDNDAVPQPTVQLTSPPVNATLFSHVPLTLAAAVSDPGGILSKVDYFLNGAPLKSAVAPGSFALDTVTPDPGTYVIKAVATDTLGRTSTSTRTITVVETGDNDPVPATAFFSDLNGRTLAGGDTITLAASAKSLRTDGRPLAGVSFYAGDELIASFDGGGNVIASARNQRGGGRRLAAAVAPAASGSVFSAAWTVPNEDEPVNLIVVAKTTGGVSQISTPLTVTAAATSAMTNHAPATVLTGVLPGEPITIGTTITVQAQVNDPDAVSSIPTAHDLARLGALRRNAAAASGKLINRVEFYLNNTKVATDTAAPYTADITLPSAGEYVLQAIATDDAGLSGVADSVAIQAVEIPTVTLVVPGTNSHSATVLEGGPVLRVRAVRTGSDLSKPLTVSYKAKGANVAGVDYKHLSGTVTIPANSSSARIKVKVLDDGVIDGNKTLKLRLVPSADGAYKVGVPAQVKVRVLDVDGIR